MIMHFVISLAAAQLVASVGVPEVLKVRLGVRFPLATTHPVWMDGEGWGVGVHRAVVTWHALGPGIGVPGVLHIPVLRSSYAWARIRPVFESLSIRPVYIIQIIESRVIYLSCVMVI